MIPCLIITQEVLVLVVPTVFFSWILFSHVPHPRTSMHQVRICMTSQHHPCLLVNKYISNMEGMDMKTPMCLFEAVGQNQPKNQGCSPQSLFLYIHTIYTNTIYIYICSLHVILLSFFRCQMKGSAWWNNPLMAAADWELWRPLQFAKKQGLSEADPVVPPACEIAWWVWYKGMIAIHKC